MYKNILIIGSSLSGKTTLAQKISEKYNYNIINLDNIIKSFKETISKIENVNYDELENIFLIDYIERLSSDQSFFNGEKFVIEGNINNLDKIINKLDKEKISVIGLVYDNLTEEQFFKDIKKHESSTDWTHYLPDNSLKGRLSNFITNNKKISNILFELDINVYDVSQIREEILNSALNDVSELTKYGSKFKVKKMK